MAFSGAISDISGHSSTSISGHSCCGNGCLVMSGFAYSIIHFYGSDNIDKEHDTQDTMDHHRAPLIADLVSKIHFKLIS